MTQFIKSWHWPSCGVQELTYVDPSGISDLERRHFPKNTAATLVYGLLACYGVTVDSMDRADVVEAIEVLTYFGRNVMATKQTGTNTYSLRLANKDRE